jgi:hypothetical protein
MPLRARILCGVCCSACGSRRGSRGGTRLRRLIRRPVTLLSVVLLGGACHTCVCGGVDGGEWLDQLDYDLDDGGQSVCADECDGWCGGDVDDRSGLTTGWSGMAKVEILRCLPPVRPAQITGIM